jgi:hypothetical protein
MAGFKLKNHSGASKRMDTPQSQSPSYFDEQSSTRKSTIRQICGSVQSRRIFAFATASL